MRQIAWKAEFVMGTLYKLFRNKEDLYKALVLEMCDRFEKIFLIFVSFYPSIEGRALS
ncbi:MAG: hypothetical protein V2B19_15140 [Pseudomonadota bacterium]